MATPCSVYRIYNADGDLLYVGVTHRGNQRNVEHVNGKAWASEVARTEWEHLPSRDDALLREIELIRDLEPKYNVTHAAIAGAEHELALRQAVDKYADARTARDAAIRAASGAGMSYRAIGEIVGLSYSRVMQIVRST